MYNTMIASPVTTLALAVAAAAMHLMCTGVLAEDYSTEQSLEVVDEALLLDGHLKHSTNHLLRSRSRSNVRGSASAMLGAEVMKGNNDNEILPQVHQLAQHQVALDHSLNDLRSFFNGDPEMLSPLAESGVSAQMLHDIQHHLISDPDLFGNMKTLDNMILNEVYPALSKIFGALEGIPSTERRILNEMDPHRQADHRGWNPRPKGSDSFSSKTGSLFPDQESIESIIDNPDRLRQYVEKMMKADQMKDAGLASIFSTSYPFRHHHRSHTTQERRSRHLLETSDTCDARCDEDDPGQRKVCNCRDLFRCVRQLKDTDFAGIFSRGLVDKESGTIQVEKEDLDGKLWKQDRNVLDEDGNLRKRANTVLDDIFDADNLLEKINRIRGLAIPTGEEEEMIQKCEALLDEFHVPCRDWQNGCSVSDGRSYRMTIDEICDAIDNSDLITFSSMSTAFDEETTAEASCYVGVQPRDNQLLDAGSNAATALFRDFTIQAPANNDLSSDDLIPDAIAAAQDFYEASSKLIDHAFVLRCLENKDECVPLSSQTTTKEETFGSGGNIELRVVYSIIEQRTLSIRLEEYHKVADNFYRFIARDTFRIELSTSVAYHDAIIAAMRDQFSGIPSVVEPCLAAECRLDTKVGLQSCQEMVDCVDRIYEAGKSIPDTEKIPNPYPFTLSNKQGDFAVNKVKDAVWNLNLALGQTAVASSTQSCTSNNICYSPFFAFDGKGDTSWASERGEKNAWLTVDLGEMFNIKEVQINWEYAPGEFEVQIPNNNGIEGNEWVTIAKKGSTTALRESSAFEDLGKVGRYIRIQCMEFFDFLTLSAGIEGGELLGGNEGGGVGTPVDSEFYEYYEISEVKVILDPVTLPPKSKWEKMAWPKEWNLSKDHQHGWETFHHGTEESSPLNHMADDPDDQSYFLSDTIFSTTFSGKLTEPFVHLVPIRKPKVCGLDTREDSRCDDARSVLFGASASVGQICSIAEAVRPQDLFTGIFTSAPENMPGTCCLDNVKTLENFGERYSCKDKCARKAPYTLGFSKEACDQVGGTWCRRPCITLKQCIENKPAREKCRVAARYEITKESFNLTHSGNECDLEDDSIHLMVTCEDSTQMDGKCKLSFESDSVLPRTSRVLIDNFDSSQHNTSDPIDVAGSEQFKNAYNQTNASLPHTASSVQTSQCIERTFNFTYHISFDEGADSDSTKVFINFVKARAGTQFDLYPLLNSTTDTLQLGSSLAITSAETITFCRNDRVYESLIALDLQNSNFIEAFDEYTQELVIESASDEGQCQQVRELMGFGLDYIDDNEICREFHEIKCDFASDEGATEIDRISRAAPKGGKISGFRGFEFKPATFNGFKFESGEFIGFDFEGFAPADDLTFNDVRKVHLEEHRTYPVPLAHLKLMRKPAQIVSKVATFAKLFKKQIKEKIRHCPIPFVIVGGSGTDAPCKIYEGSTRIAYIVFLNIVVSLIITAFVLGSIYNWQHAFKDEHHYEQYYWTEATYKNINILNTAVSSNLDIINNNINNQHNEVRSTLSIQHSTMMKLLSSQHTEIGTQLTDQHNSIGDQLTEQHTSIGEQLTEQHNSVGKQLTDQHNSIGTQLTEHHRTLKDDILRLAYALGGRMSNAALNPILEFEGPSPYDILVEILARLNGTDTGIMQNLTARSQSEKHVDSNHTSIELKLEDSTADIMRNCSAETTRVEVHVTSKTAEILDFCTDEATQLEALIDDKTVKILAHCSAEASQIEKQIDSATAEVSRNCTFESSKIEARIGATMAAMSLENDIKTAALSLDITNASVAIRNNITLELSQMESKLSNAQTTMADKISGLEIEAKCVHSPGGGSESSNSAMGKSISTAFMVYTKSHSEPMEAKVDFVDIVFQGKDGTVQSQPASAVTTTPLPAGSGRQHVRVTIETSKDAIQNMNSVLIVDIHVVDSEGRTNRASIVPCGPPCSK